MVKRKGKGREKGKGRRERGIGKMSVGKGDVV